MDEKTKHKQNQLIKMVSEFCDDKLNDEYKQLAIKLVEKMGRKRDVPFKRGKLDIWASAVIYALAQINFLFDKSFEPYLSTDDICDYFNTKKSTVSQKASKISDMFNLAPFDNEFSAKEISSEAPKVTVDENGLIVPASEMDIFFDDVYHLFESGKVDEALNKLDTIDEDNPEYPRALFYKSMMLQDDDEQSLNLFKQAIMGEMSNVFGDEVAEAFLNGESDELLDDLTDFNDPEDLFDRGFTDYQLGDYEDALEFFNLSLDIDSNQSEVLYYKALTLFNMGESKKALLFIDKAIKIDSADDRFWNDKGNILASLNHVSKAHKCFDKAIKLNPEDSVIWANKGFLYKEYEKYDKALECYDNACDLNPEDIHNIIGKANVYMDMGDDENAEKYLNEASQIDDEDLEYLTAKAHFLWNQLKLEESLKYWDKCLKIDDERADIWVFKSMIYLMMKDEEKADECIDKAAEIDPFIIHMFNELLDDI